MYFRAKRAVSISTITAGMIISLGLMTGCSGGGSGSSDSTNTSAKQIQADEFPVFSLSGLWRFTTQLEASISIESDDGPDQVDASIEFDDHIIIDNEPGDQYSILACGDLNKEVFNSTSFEPYLSEFAQEPGIDSETCPNPQIDYFQISDTEFQVEVMCDGASANFLMEQLSNVPAFQRGEFTLDSVIFGDNEISTGDSCGSVGKASFSSNNAGFSVTNILVSGQYEGQQVSIEFAFVGSGELTAGFYQIAEGDVAEFSDETIVSGRLYVNEDITEDGVGQEISSGQITLDILNDSQVAGSLNVMINGSSLSANFSIVLR